MMTEKDHTELTKNDIVLYDGPNLNLQEKIDALDGNKNVKTLIICPEDEHHEYDEYADSFKLDIRLPNLEELNISDVSISRLNLIKKTTPNLRKLSISNPRSRTDISKYTLNLPELKDFSISYWYAREYRWLHRMLAKATKLERFDSYKLGVNKLKLNSNNLEYVNLHRAEFMRDLTLWAPRLTKLNLQACYDLVNVCFLESHPLSKELPTNFSIDTELVVDVTNAILGDMAMKNLKDHPRIHGNLKTGLEFY